MFFTYHWDSWQLCNTFVYQIPFPGPGKNSFWGWRPKPDAKFFQVKESLKFPQPTLGSPGDAAVKNPLANAGDARDAGSSPESGKSPRVGNGNPAPYFCLENSMDRGAWQAAEIRVAELDRTEHTPTSPTLPLPLPGPILSKYLYLPFLLNSCDSFLWLKFYFTSLLWSEI